MFKSFKVICLVGFIAASCLSFLPVAFADEVSPAPEINGPTGLVRIPSAGIVPYKNSNVGANYGSVLNTNGQISSEGAVNYMINLGAYQGLEVGIVGGTNQVTNQIREGVFVNAKLSLPAGDEPDALRLALGVENLFSYTQTDVYMVATKHLNLGPKLTFGFMGDFPNNEFRALGLLGVEAGVSNNLFLLADMMAGQTLFQLNGGIRYYFTPIFALNISGLNLLNGSQVKDQRTAQIGFSWANPF
jgi:hypothetical protein